MNTVEGPSLFKQGEAMIISKEGDKFMRAQRVEKARRKRIKAETVRCPICGVKAPKHFVLCPKELVN